MDKDSWQNNPKGYKVVSQYDNEKQHQQQQFIVHQEKKDTSVSCVCAVQ